MIEKPFDVTIDREKRVITIQGIRYCFDLFDAIGFMPIGRQLKIIERGDGVVTLAESDPSKQPEF